MRKLLLFLVLCLTLSACQFDVPGDPPVHLCWPRTSWRCHPDIEWSDM